MRTRTKVILWILPILLVVLEILVVPVIDNGILVPWQYVGKPGENIDRIIGYKTDQGAKLYVLTISGGIYSIPYDYFHDKMGQASIPSHVQWIKERDANVQFHASSSVPPCGSPPPPLFKIKQIYEIQYPAIESCSEARFVLSEGGDLWIWFYQYGWTTPLRIIFFLFIIPIEILIYPLAIVILSVVSVIKRIRKKQKEKMIEI